MSRYACIFAEWWTGWNRKPLTILLFVPACLVFVGIGAVLGAVQLFLLIVTTALSADASLTTRMGLLQQAQAAGDEPRASDMPAAVKGE